VTHLYFDDMQDDQERAWEEQRIIQNTISFSKTTQTEAQVKVTHNTSDASVGEQYRNLN
jgi:hypothetical protein